MTWFLRKTKGIQTPTKDKKDVPDGLWFKLPSGKIIHTRESSMEEENSEDLNMLRKKRMENLRRSAEEEQQQAKLKEQMDAKKNAAMRIILTPEARLRLANIKMVRPEFAEAIELQLIQLAQSGRLSEKISDEQLKQILKQITGRKREGKITFR